jgi:hypothetical protein
MVGQAKLVVPILGFHPRMLPPMHPTRTTNHRSFQSTTTSSHSNAATTINNIPYPKAVTIGRDKQEGDHIGEKLHAAGLVFHHPAGSDQWLQAIRWLLQLKRFILRTL